MRIGVDAMGGDFAPREIVRGAIAAAPHLSADDEVVLYGLRQTIEAELEELGGGGRIQIEDCPDVIGMEESPVDAVRQKRDSTIVRMATDAGNGRLDGLISAGNTGAFAAACQFRIKPIKGVSRAGIAVVMPTFHGPVLICDVGANVVPKPHHLHEYARMCAIYARAVLGIENPSVGLVSIGEEATKGNTLVRQARQLIQHDLSLNFIGNVEGRDIFAGTGNIFVCDGFVGNVILKLTEGLAEGLFKTILKELEQESLDLMRSFQPCVDRIWQKHDFAEYGGAPLLGINRVAIICHGRSDHRAVRNAIRAAGDVIRANLMAVIADHMSQIAGGVG
jgi:glycerol-3-phosphate acyltransferase PlsX